MEKKTTTTVKRRSKTAKIRRQKRQVAFLTLIILIASIVAIMLLTPGFNISKIEVYGNTAVTDEEIKQASGIVTGINIFSVNMDEAEDNIKTMAYIEDVQVKRVFPSTIKITVEEEAGVAYFSSKKGYAIITSAGKCIEITDGMKGEGADGKHQTASLPDLPQVVGIRDIKYKIGKTITAENPRQLEALFECLHEFTKKGYIFDMNLIDMSDLNDIRFYYQGRELCVSVGDTEKIGYKMECFGPIYSEVAKMYKDSGKPKGFIDLERLTYRKEINPTVKKEVEDDEKPKKKKKTQ